MESEATDELTLALSISCLFTAKCPSSAFRCCFFFCFSSDACNLASFEGEGGPSCHAHSTVVSEQGPVTPKNASILACVRQQDMHAAVSKE